MSSDNLADISDEILGRAIYLAVYKDQGGKWEANENKEVWYAKARLFRELVRGR